MTALYIVAGILLLGWLPLSGRLRYNGTGVFILKYAGIPVWRLRLDQKEKPSKTKRPPKSSKKGKEDTASAALKNTWRSAASRLKEGSVQDAVALLRTVAAEIWRAVRPVLRAVGFKRCAVQIAVGGGDAETVALTYGRLCGPVYAAESVVRQWGVKCLKVDMRPDFTREKDAVAADVCGCTCVWMLLVASLVATVRFWKLTNRLSPNGKDVL